MYFSKAIEQEKQRRHNYSRSWLHASMHFNVCSFWFLKLFKFIIAKKKIIGTCFESRPIFHHFEFYNNVINCAKLNYSTMEIFMLTSFKHFKMRFLLDLQCKIWRKHHYAGLTSFPNHYLYLTSVFSLCFLFKCLLLYNDNCVKEKLHFTIRTAMQCFLFLAK